MTSIETRQPWSERFHPRNWTLTWKLVAVGVVPALLALVLGVLRVYDQASEAASLGRSTDILGVHQQVTTTSDAVRQERDEATGFVAGGRTDDTGVLDIGFGRTDGEVDKMLAAIKGTEGLDESTVAALQRSESQLGALGQLRSDVSQSAANFRDVRTGYDDIVASIDVLERAILREVRTPSTAGLADALTAVTDVREQLAVQHTILSAGIRAGNLPVEDGEEVRTDSELEAAYQQYQIALTPAQIEQFGRFIEGPANQKFDQLVLQIVSTPPDQRITVPETEWDSAYNESLTEANIAGERVRGEILGRSQAAEEQSSNLAGINSVILMLGLMIGIAVAVLIARALIRSLRLLRTSALEVADRRLPLAVEALKAGHTVDAAVEPVPLSSKDEVGQVARAFDAVHGQAIRLAADQAALQAGVSAMFVNLSRRSQALVERQLSLIEQLESNEQDSDQLSNLFQLDHLATRMRRNSENLLVLAGTDLAKRNVAPVPMVDVLRAAVSEVESYQRIVVQTPPTATVAGRAASDIVHLLAELLDNATNFSPPDSQVVMSSTRTPSGEIMVEIADRGVGMTDAELMDANQRLNIASSVDVSASRRMGLFVIGRLATRHNVAVRLSAAPGGQGNGLTASVTIPTNLIPSLEPAEAGTRPGMPVGAPSAAGAAGVRPGAPSPLAGLNGAARAGGLSSLVTGNDGTANPAGVFDTPAGGDGDLFSSPNPPEGGEGPSLPARRPGSTLRPGGGPPTPSEQGTPAAAGAQGPTPEEAREVAAQARRDQEAAAVRSAAARAQNLLGRNGARPGSDARTPSDLFSAPDKDGSASSEEPPAESGQQQARKPAGKSETQQAQGLAGGLPKAPQPKIAGQGPAGLPRRAPGGRPGLPKRGEQSGDAATPERPGPIRSSAFAPLPESERQTPAQQEPEAKAAESAQPAPRPRPAPAPREQNRQVWTPPEHLPTRPNKRGQESTLQGLSKPPEPVDGQEAAAQSGPDIAKAPQKQGPRDGSGMGPLTMPMPAIQPDQPAPGTGQQNQRANVRPNQQESGPTPRPTPRPVPRPGAQQGGNGPTPAGTEQQGPPQQQGPSHQPVDGDALFAANVPAIEPMTSTPEARRPSGFELGETTPIFEEIASAWFRSNRPIPVSWQQGEQEAEPPAAPAPNGQSQPTVEALAPEQQPAPEADVSPAPVTVDAASLAPPVQEQDFASAADEGWAAAASAVNANAEKVDETTSAGLPKRRPRARLVPGSAGSSATVLAAAQPASRSAESIRGRLASYQQGIRQGRETRLRQQGSAHGANGGPAHAGGNHDEESS